MGYVADRWKWAVNMFKASKRRLEESLENREDEQDELMEVTDSS